jgi:hypothetical protein
LSGPNYETPETPVAHKRLVTFLQLANQIRKQKKMQREVWILNGGASRAVKNMIRTR